MHGVGSQCEPEEHNTKIKPAQQEEGRRSSPQSSDLCVDSLVCTLCSGSLTVWSSVAGHLPSEPVDVPLVWL